MKESFLPLGRRVQYSALLIGLAGLILVFAGAYFEPRQSFLSYLFAYLFWTGISLGGMVILMIYHLTGGAWGRLIRCPLEAAAQALPLMAILFIPLIFGLADLYVWAQPDTAANGLLLQEKSGHLKLQEKSVYLNVTFFLIRAAIYFLIWLGIVYWLNKWSREQDHNPQSKMAIRLQRLSAGGLILYSLSITFAATDWVMSLIPVWYSTAFGLLFGVEQMLSALAFAILITAFLSRSYSLSKEAISNHFHDLGNLLLMFIMLWAYLAFMQFLIIWAGNLPHEISWYLPRIESGWKGLGIFLILFHFAAPFIILLFRRTKRTISLLTSVAAIVLLAYLADIFWLVVPSLRTQGFQLYWTDLAAPIGIGGIWLATVFWRLQRRLPGLIQAPDAKEEAAEYG